MTLLKLNVFWSSPESGGVMVGVLKPSKSDSIGMSSSGVRPLGSTKSALLADASEAQDPNESAWYDGSLPLYDVPIED